MNMSALAKKKHVLPDMENKDNRWIFSIDGKERGSEKPQKIHNPQNT